MTTAESLKVLQMQMDELAARIRDGHPTRPEGDSVIVTDAVALMRVWQAALVDLSTKSHYSARDTSGESSSRRVQMVAARALSGER